MFVIQRLNYNVRKRLNIKKTDEIILNIILYHRFNYLRDIYIS